MRAELASFLTLILAGHLQGVPAPAGTSLTTIARTTTPGFLPFGAVQPDPVVNPDALDQLRALGIHATLVVTVGDDGHTKDIEFRPALDSSSESRVHDVLQNVRWDPAVCGGGVACEGHATITI